MNLPQFFPIVFLALAVPVMAASAPVSSDEIYVIDGDTIRYRETKFRLVGFDTPETYRPKCSYEKALGVAATDRAKWLIQNSPIVDLVVLPGKDKYQRGLARLYVYDQDLAHVLVSEGLALLNVIEN